MTSRGRRSGGPPLGVAALGVAALGAVDGRHIFSVTPGTDLPAGRTRGCCEPWCYEREMRVRKINVPEVAKLPAFSHATVAGQQVFISGMLSAPGEELTL